MDRACSSINQMGLLRYNSRSSKNPAVTALQDLLFYQLTGVAFFAKKISSFKKADKEINSKLTRLIYLTNKSINFSVNVLVEAINDTYNLKVRIENLYRFLCKNNSKKMQKSPLSAMLKPGDTLAQLVSQANIINVQKTIKSFNFKVYSIKEAIRESISSSANYLEHIKNEDNLPKSVYTLIYDILEVLGDENASISDCKTTVLKAGELHTQVLELILATYEKKYGFIEHRKISTDFKKGSAILLVGEDFRFLQRILEFTMNKSINIYTYGVLNYAHVFPEINKYTNLAGIYRGKYSNFALDIEHFPGVVVLTSGNLEELREIFRGRIFSTEDISMLGVTRIDKNNLKPLLNAAYDAPGFSDDKKNCYLEAGFGIKELELTSQKIVELLKTKKIDNITIFLGVNNFSKHKEFLKDVMKSIPKKSYILTLESSFGLELSADKSFPFVLNLGQFVNLYSLVRLLYSVSGKFKKDINEMPINITINLRSPDTIAALFMLLSLGMKNIQITSELSNYLTDAIISTFYNDYGIYKFSQVEKDNLNQKKL